MHCFGSEVRQQFEICCAANTAVNAVDIGCDVFGTATDVVFGGLL
jgi:hypothetical protein